MGGGDDGRDALDRFLGLEAVGEGQWRLTVRDDTSNPAGVLYGGCPVAVSIELAERVLGAPVRWSTTRFLSVARSGDTLDVAVRADVAGRSNAQVTVTGGHDGDVVFETILATGRGRDEMPAGQWGTPPDAPSPEDAPARAQPAEIAHTAVGTIERRTAFGTFPEDGVVEPSGRLAMWMRVPGLPSASDAVQGWLADCVPLALAVGLGMRPGGISLDNTMRFSAPPEAVAADDWVLVDIAARSAVDGYGHGTADLWSRDGVLLATGSQTAILRPNP